MGLPGALSGLGLLLAAAAARPRGIMHRPNAQVTTRSGRVVDYHVIRSRARRPFDRHNAGGDRGPCYVRTNVTAFEVSHTNEKRAVSIDTTAFWAYRARGRRLSRFSR